MAYISFQPRDNFKTQLYTGTGASNAQTFPDTTAMQPDFVWIKNRDATDQHILTDSVRGATINWYSDDSVVEVTETERLKSFDSDGFTVGTNDAVNTNTEDYASWNWKMGTTSGLTGGSITPTGYSLNTTAGQSIIAYTGAGSAATIPHGLGAVPKFILIKNRNYGNSGITYHEAMSNTYYCKIDGDGAKDNSYGTATWNDTSPTSTVFSVGGNSHTSGSYNYIAYCFADIKGYSKFGSYEGNGNVDGIFVYTGFRPAYVCVKCISGTGYWQTMDDKRVGYNPTNYLLYPNVTDVGGTESMADILSNGFKFRVTSSHSNGNGATYMYMAFAEFPTVSSNSKAGTAR